MCKQYGGSEAFLVGLGQLKVRGREVSLIHAQTVRACSEGFLRGLARWNASCIGKQGGLFSIGGERERQLHPTCSPALHVGQTRWRSPFFACSLCCQNAIAVLLNT